MERELELVELVSPDGVTVGSATVADAHTAPGALHRAFSVLLFDTMGRTLLQRRAATKSRFALRWANACCGHPRPGEPVEAAAARRLAEELGVRGVELSQVGVHTYDAVDSATGRVEREYDHVLVGRIPDGFMIAPDPEEVAETQWASGAKLRQNVTGTTAHEYAPWLAGVLRIAPVLP